MRKLVTVLGTVLVASTFAAATSIALDHGGPTFVARLSGANEVPPVETHSAGQMQIRFDRDRTEGRFRLNVTNGRRVTQAHIHCGPEGQNGPVVLFLAGFHDRGWDVNGRFVEATLTNDNIVNTACGETLADIVESMRAGNTYVNVHTVANPSGEVRGQLRRR